MIDKNKILKKKPGRKKIANNIDKFITYSINRILKDNCISVGFTIDENNNVSYTVNNNKTYKVYYCEPDFRFKNKLRRKLRYIKKKFCKK